jgi:antitoxin (DNA-binding transcriptional repressor) of toxin-antitoxin stability system
MKRIDLDDLPPKVADVLQAVAPGEEVVLVKDGLVFARLVGGAPEAAPEPEAEEPSNEKAREIFEQFRSLMEDDF